MNSYCKTFLVVVAATLTLCLYVCAGSRASGFDNCNARGCSYARTGA